MAKVKQQHYVPQGFIKNYFYTGDNNYKVFVLNRKRKGNDYPSTIYKICKESGMYDISKDDNEQLVEKYLSQQIEEPFCSIQQEIIRQVNQNTLAPFTSPTTIDINKIDFSNLISAQLYRTPKSKKRINSEAHAHATKFFNELPTEIKDRINSEQFTSKIQQDINNGVLYSKVMEYSFTEEAKSKSQFLSNRTWIFFKTDIDIPLTEEIIIPVKLNSDKSGYYKVGIMNADIIYVPIARNIIIAMFHPIFYPNEVFGLDMTVANVKFVNDHIYLSKLFGYLLQLNDTNFHFAHDSKFIKSLM